MTSGATTASVDIRFRPDPRGNGGCAENALDARWTVHAVPFRAGWRLLGMLHQIKRISA